MKKVITESGFARINRILQGNASTVNTYGIISGENPCGCEFSTQENTKMDEKLKSILKSKKYGYQAIGGNFFHNDEKSYMIPNITKKDLVSIGVNLKQYSVIFGVKNINPEGRVYMSHQMLRTFCDEPCVKTRKWETLPLDSKLKGLKPLTKTPGEVESRSNVSLTTGDITNRLTDYSHSNDKERKFVIPFYDDTLGSSYPSTEVGRNVVPYRDELYSDSGELSLDDKFMSTQYRSSTPYVDDEEVVKENKIKKIVRVTENDLTKIVKKVISERDIINSMGRTKKT